MSVVEDLRRKTEALEAANRRRWVPWPHQTPDATWFDPAHPHQYFMLNGGRDSGKTYAGAQLLSDHIESPPCIPGPVPHKTLLLAPTLPHVREAMVNDPESGLLAVNRTAPPRVVGGEQSRKLVWPNGATTYFVSTETVSDVDHLNGPGSNACFVWWDEAAKSARLRYAVEQLDHALRAGAKPRGVVTSTPRPRAAFRWFASRRSTLQKRGSTFDNETRGATDAGRARWERLRADYVDNPRGRAELFGELDAPDPRALFSLESIDGNRLITPPPERFVITERAVAIDPADGGDATGVVAGVTVADCWCGNGAPLPHFLVTDDASRVGRIDTEMPRASRFRMHHQADAVVVESNGVGGRAIRTLQLVDPLTPIVTVSARDGKDVRAEPVVMLYDADRVHHYGDPMTFAELELEQTTWVSPRLRGDGDDPAPESPNRLDALVYLITYLAGLDPAEGAWWL